MEAIPTCTCTLCGFLFRWRKVIWCKCAAPWGKIYIAWSALRVIINKYWPDTVLFSILPVRHIVYLDLRCYGKWDPQAIHDGIKEHPDQGRGVSLSLSWSFSLMSSTVHVYLKADYFLLPLMFRTDPAGRAIYAGQKSLSSNEKPWQGQTRTCIVLHTVCEFAGRCIRPDAINCTDETTPMQ